MFTFYLNGKTFFLTRTNVGRYVHTWGEREHGFGFFFYDERDYGIKDARPCQLSSVWTKAAPSGSTMTSIDECLLPWWRCAQLPQFLEISSTRASDWNSKVAVGLQLSRLTWDQGGGDKNRGISLKSMEGERMEREHWDRSVASKKDLYISRLCFPFFCCCRGWICVESGTAAEQDGWQWQSCPQPLGKTGELIPLNAEQISLFCAVMTWATDAFNDPSAKYGHQSAGISW